MMRFLKHSGGLLFVAGLCAAAPASAGKHHITGQIVDRNGQPLARAVVSLSPGDVYLVTDREGRFLINYLREEDGRRTRLDKKVDYELEIFKIGYHDQHRAVAYKRGMHEVETITLREETLAVEDDPADISDLYDDEVVGNGHSLEGE